MKPINLRIRILTPLILLLILLLGAYVVNVIKEEKKHIEEDFYLTVHTLTEYYHTLIDERAKKLEAILAVFLDDDAIRPALKSSEREILLKHAQPLFYQLKSKHEITHLYFHNPQQVNLLRVHQPERYGDTIDRFTLLAAKQSGKVAHGVEIGPLGAFTLRAVSPVYDGDLLLGYIELGEEVNDLFTDMAKIPGTEVIATINKHFLNRSDWEVGLRTFDHIANWDFLPNAVIVSKSLSVSAGIINEILNQSTQDNYIDLSLDDKQYRVASIGLRDANHQEVGRMVLLQDITDRINNQYRILLNNVIGTMFLAGLLIAFFYWLLGRTEKKIHEYQASIAKSEQHMRLHYDQAPMGLIEWDTDFKVADWNPAAENIFGYSKDEAIGCHACDLIIPPDAKKEVEAVWRHLMLKKDVIHQVNENSTKDGQVRVCEWYNTPLVDQYDKLVGVVSLVEDITEKRKAEMLSLRMGRILEHSWNEIYTFDVKTLNFIDVSEGARKNLGYSLDEMRQITPVDLKPEFTFGQFEALIAPLLRGEEQNITFETKHLRKNGTSYPVEVRLQLSNIEVPPVFIAIIQDVSERIRYITELEHKALYDPLTDLPNRSLLQDRLEHALTIASRETSSLSVFLVDVMRLNEINEILGYQTGDLVLQEVASRIPQILRKSDTVSSMGGAEFAIMLPSINKASGPVMVEKIQWLFDQPVIIEDNFLDIEIAIGIAIYPEHGDTPANLLQHADIALHKAKNETSGWSFYDPDDDPSSLRLLKLHGELRQAIKNNALALYYQPQIDIKTGTVVSVEALARWPHHTEGMISPGDFIPIIEQSGLIRPFTLWVMDEAMKQIKLWLEDGIDVAIGINLSTRNLIDPKLPGNIEELLNTHKVNPKYITLEVTESAIMSRPEISLKVLTQLHEMGFKLSIDDFGTGYSSLAYLKKLPVHEVKIDQSFVFGLTTNQDDNIIVRSTIDLAQNMGLKVVAEGVEDQETLEVLSILSCDLAQGFHMSRPLPVQDFEIWLDESSWGFKKDS